MTQKHTDEKVFLPLRGKSIKEWTDDFIEQFNELKPKSAEHYDRLRRPGTPSWQTLAKYNSFTRWRDFLASLGLEMASGIPKEFTVTHTIRIGDMYISDEEFCHGVPSVETMQRAIECSVNYDMKSLEKLSKYVKA